MAKATIQLDRITVINKRDEIGKDDPYLWVIGLQIVVPSSNVPGLEFIRAVNPLPGNLGGGFKRGESRAIPAAIGKIEYDVTYPGQATFGVVVIAWDHDRTPEASIKSAYDQACRLIDGEIRTVVDAIIADGPDPKTNKFRGVTQGEQDGIRTRVKALIKDIFLHSLSVVPWTLNFDDFVGAERVIETVTGNAPFSKPFTMELRKHEHIGAHYQITGQLRFVPPAA